MIGRDSICSALADETAARELTGAGLPGEVLGTGAPLAVLVVDDHPAHRLCAQAIFEALGCRVALVESGAAALEACAHSRFDVVLMDRNMPGGHGDQAVRRLRRREGPSHHTFVVCCSSDPPRDLSAGYDLLAPKPLTVAGAAEVLRWVAEHAVAARSPGAQDS
jgi:CheY-like chemotaxis protein